MLFKLETFTFVILKSKTITKKPTMMKKLILAIALFAFISAGTANAAISVFSGNTTEVVKGDKDKEKRKKKKEKKAAATKDKKCCSKDSKKKCGFKLFCSPKSCTKKQSTNKEEVQ